MKARDVMSKGVMSVAADASVLEAIELLVNTQVSAMPVVDKDGIVVGIVSEADLVPFAGLAREFLSEASAGLALEELNSRRVSDIMKSDVITVDADDPLLHVVDTIKRYRVKRVPVRQGKSIVGVISRIDLLRAIVSRWAAGAATSSGNDEQLRRTVLATTQGQTWSLAERFDVIAMSGSVHLWGVVPTENINERYCGAAEAVPGVKKVISHMTVRPAHRSA